MPFQRSNSAASTQLLSASIHEPSASSLSSLLPATATKSSLAESSSKSRSHPHEPNSAPAPPRKQHHVSFQEHPEPSSSVSQNASKRRGRNQRASDQSLRPDTSHLRDKHSEHGSSRHSNSRASSRQSRCEPSELGSSKSVGPDSAPSSSSRQRRSRHRSDKRSEQSNHNQSERRAKSDPEDPASSQIRVAPSSRSEASTSTSKKQSRSREPSLSGKRSRQPSAQAIVPDLHNHETSRSGAATRSHYSASSRRDRFTRPHDARSIPGEASTSRDGRQLFDPRRDDPVKFASQQRNQVDDRARSASAAASPRLTPASLAQPQILMRRDASGNSSASHLGRSPIIQPSLSSHAFAPAIDPTDPRALQVHLVEIKKVYRSISSLEASLQEAHQAEVEKARLNMADYTPPDLRDLSYWINLISRHRDLAECHSFFLEMTCRPELPRSIQELGEVYNLPSRLWQTAFHLMLESLRSSLSSQHHLQSKERKGEILEHLTEFIYYAYSFYSALQESERYKCFRRAWIESLGDLSRYRMAVAGLAANMSIDSGGSDIRNIQSDQEASDSSADARIDDDDLEEDDGSDLFFGESDRDDDNVNRIGQQVQHVGNAPKQIRPRQNDRANDTANHPTGRKPEKAAKPTVEVDKASIGTAALGDWEWTEKETWRQTAKDWYAMGITETPNIGRLHHHLGVLSRGEDDLRALYHLTKSLISAKPFVSAKDSILTLFDQERQARRLRRDSSVKDLFLYLHGILITRVQLDDFEPVSQRLLARLTKLVEEQGPAALPQSVWTMMATINIAGLFQYGHEDSILADLLPQQTGKSSRHTNRAERSKINTPTAILVSSTTSKTDDNFLSELPRDAEWVDPSDEESEVDDDVQVISLEPKATNDEVEAVAELPGMLEKAAKLCFDIQSLTFDLSSDDALYRSNPYNTTISTFLVSLCQSKKAFRMLERFIPWHLWLQHVEMSVSLTERTWPKCLATSYITAQLILPEDFCLRGILGLSRQLFDRNLWRNATNDGAISSPQGFDNEVQVLDAKDGELYTRTESAWRIAASRRRDSSESPTSLDTVRAYRMAFVARKLAKAARGFDFDSKTSTLSLSKFLLSRLARRKMEEEHRQLEARIRELQLQTSAASDSAAQEDIHEKQPLETDEDDDFDSDWDSETEGKHSALEADAVLAKLDEADATDEIKALHARSCYLRDVLQNVGCRLSGKQSWPAAGSKGHEGGTDKYKGGAAQPNAWDNIVPGYTILVVDTNIIVTPGDVIAQLIESQRWTVIIPLAVITELDGLRRNDNELGQEAERAIQFLEARIRSHAKYVKVQTSRGNYLSDLSCRSEDIDFTWQGSVGSGAPVASHQLDAVASGNETKSVAARNVDEVILRILAWQTDKFVDRRNLLRSSAAANSAAGTSSKGDGPKADSSRETMSISSAHKSVLLTLDRNLRLKAKSRGLVSLDAKGAAGLLELSEL